MWRCGNTVTNSIQWQTGWKQLFFFQLDKRLKGRPTLSIVAADGHRKTPADERTASVESISDSVHLVDVFFAVKRRRKK